MSLDFPTSAEVAERNLRDHHRRERAGDAYWDAHFWNVVRRTERRLEGEE